MLLMRTEHIPVMASELVSLLDPRPGEVAIDATFGAGGHARLVAERLGPDGLLVAIDRDPEAEERFEELSPELPCRSRFLRASFADGLRELRDEGLAADIAWFDFGVSSMQIDTPERGFSYSSEAPLDMRMDPTAGGAGLPGHRRMGRAPAGPDVPRIRRGALLGPDRPGDRPRA